MGAGMQPRCVEHLRKRESLLLRMSSVGNRRGFLSILIMRREIQGSGESVPRKEQPQKTSNAGNSPCPEPRLQPAHLSLRNVSCEVEEPKVLCEVSYTGKARRATWILRKGLGLRELDCELDCELNCGYRRPRPKPPN